MVEESPRSGSGGETVGLAALPAGASATRRRRRKQPPVGTAVPRVSATLPEISSKSPQCWGCGETRERVTLQARVSAAGSGAPATSVCKVAEASMRNEGGFGPTELGQAKAKL